MINSEAVQKKAYEGDKGLIELKFERNTTIEQKPVAALTFGSRLRIAKLHQDHEPYVGHLIQVCGWARSVREGGKSADGVEIFFLELYDGSCASSLQCVIDASMPNYKEIAL